MVQVTFKCLDQLGLPCAQMCFWGTETNWNQLKPCALKSRIGSAGLLVLFSCLAELTQNSPSSFETGVESQLLEFRFFDWQCQHISWSFTILRNMGVLATVAVGISRNLKSLAWSGGPDPDRKNREPFWSPIYDTLALCVWTVQELPCLGCDVQTWSKHRCSARNIWRRDFSHFPWSGASPPSEFLVLGPKQDLHHHTLKHPMSSLPTRTDHL